MTEEMYELLLVVTSRLERAITDRDCPAIVALQGDRRLILFDYDYLHDMDSALAFEMRAAEKAHEIGCQRFVFAVPMIWRVTDELIISRPVTNTPTLTNGEEEVIEWTAFHPAEGIDYGCVPYTRRPNNEPIFDDPHTVVVSMRPDPRVPGLTLARQLLSDESLDMGS